MYVRLAFFSLIVCAVMLAASVGCSRRILGTDTIEKARTFVEANEGVLTNYANEVLAGRIARVDPFVYFAPPSVKTDSVKLHAVTTDENRNVYFVFSESFTTFNVGVIYQSEGRAFLGDQMEPTIVTNAHLFGKWFYYKAN